MSSEANLPVVEKLNKLWIFGPDQAGSYREHFQDLAEVLGRDIETNLRSYLRRWAGDDSSGLCILTGNAGTGKTAAAEEFCVASGAALPDASLDGLIEIAPNRWVAKDLSGLLPPEQVTSLKAARQLSRRAKVLVCANEGVLRDAVTQLADSGLDAVLDAALRTGAHAEDGTLIINVNRQRPTSPPLWNALVDYVTQTALWTGCEGCPESELTGCPFISNSAALRSPQTREALRRLVQIASGDAVPTLRELLAVLAQAITGGRTCNEIKDRARDRGARDLHAGMAFYACVLGDGLAAEAIERSPLLVGLREAGLGEQADLEIDQWLRDSTVAPEAIKLLAGAPESSDEHGELAGSRSHLDRVHTQVGTMTFGRLGATISTSEDTNKVEAGLVALVRPPAGATPAISLWRRRVFFQGSEVLGGIDAAASRLLRFRYFGDLVSLARRAASGDDLAVEISELVKGLNFLVTGFSSYHDGLVVPDSSCLFARNPGSYRPARPSLVHGEIPVDEVRIVVPDSGLVETLLDVDHIEILLVAGSGSHSALRVGPTMYEAIREAAAYRGPVGQGAAEMADLRAFYGGLATCVPADGRMRVADPSARPPALITVSLPRFER